MSSMQALPNKVNVLNNCQMIIPC